MPTTVADRIEKQIVLQAPRSRVWRALSDAEEFGRWFGVKLQGAFSEGATIRGQITHPGYEHLMMEVFVERVEPERYIAWRWHPYAVDPKIDYSKEPTTLVEFHLKEIPKGTEVTVVESGFSQIPLGRRDEAFRMNEGGWTQQMRNIEHHVAQS
jgi:uncharacterized protein YndB with AHSA1/START domain